MEDYNKIYEKIMGAAENGLVGMIAYSRYKANKRQWIIDYKGVYEGQQPDERAYHTFELAQTDNQVAMYITDAETMLGEFYSQLLRDNYSDIKEGIESEGIMAIVDKGIKELKSAVKPSYLYDIWMSFLGAFAYSFVLLIILLSIRYLGVDLAKAFFQLEDNKKIETKHNIKPSQE